MIFYRYSDIRYELNFRVNITQLIFALKCNYCTLLYQKSEVESIPHVKGAMHCLQSRSSFISARDLFGPQENHESFIANVRNVHDKLPPG